MAKTYDTYKDSGIAWIGEIPGEWEVSKMKYIGTYINGYAFKPSDWQNSGKPIIRIQDLTGSISNSNYYNGDLEEKYLVKKGDILVSWAATLDAFIWEKEEEGWLNQHIFKALPNICVINKHYFFWLVKVAMSEMNNDNKHGIVMQHVTLGVFNLFKIPLPPLSEQEDIATCLDEKCGEIDSLISIQEEMISELLAYKQSVITEAVTKGLDKKAKMKNSGVEWIGDIPEEWEVKRIKFAAEVWGRIGFRGYKSEDLNKDGIGAITLSPSNMKSFNMDYSNVTYLSWEKYNESPEIKIQNGDILYVKTGSSYGKACFVENLPREATINPQILRIVSLINSKYLCYFMQTSSIKYETECGVVGGTIPTISQEKIKNMFIAAPPLPVQQAIATYLDEKTSQIDSLIALKQSKIESLKEYKKSIIYEYVTGKKRV